MHLFAGLLKFGTVIMAVPMSHVKEILGHADIQTTAKYYLGVDKQSIKAAHARFLRFE